MNPLFEAAREISEFAEARKWRYCIIGGLALLRWGEPRMTLDVDVSIWTGFGPEKEYIRALLEHFRPRVSDAVRFALDHRVVLLFASNGQEIDVALAALPFEEEMMDRATPFVFAPGLTLRTCSAEDLFVMKVFAGRPRDWVDAEGILARVGDRFDRAYVLRHIEWLAEVKEDSAWAARVRNLLAEAR